MYLVQEPGQVDEICQPEGKLWQHNLHQMFSVFTRSNLLIFSVGIVLRLELSDDSNIIIYNISCSWFCIYFGVWKWISVLYWSFIYKEVIRFLHRLEKVNCQSGEKMRSLGGSPFTFLKTWKREINSSILLFYIFIVHKHLYANLFPALTSLRIIHIFAFAAEQWQQHQPVVFHPLLLPVQCQSPEPGVEFHQGWLLSLCQPGKHFLVRVFLQQSCPKGLCSEK